MTLVRHPDWPSRLRLFLLERAKQPFVWGGQDCCLFPCDGVLAITGTDPAQAFRGRYNSRKTALQALAEFMDYDGTPPMAAKQMDCRHRPPMGLSHLLEATARKIGCDLQAPVIPVLTARRGDVVFARHTAGASLGLVVDHRAAFAGKAGLVFLPVADASLAWRV